ncbi:MAG: Fur family transcriptional regulator [Chloroflexota bacterium]|nr:Fur family transcriptional regulator [Chloroflexota bacterium]
MEQLPISPTDKMKQEGYKLTPQRLAILDVFSNSPCHLTPAEVFEELRDDHPEIGLVTVYRTLEIFSKLGIVTEVYANGNSPSYTLLESPEQCHCLICSGCGKVFHFSDCDLDDLKQRLSLLTGFKIEDHLLQLQGLCDECQDAIAIEL